MPGKKERGLFELYDTDPEKADWELWGREADPVSRRGFLKDTGLAFMALTVGAHIPYARFMPQGLIPVALADAGGAPVIEGKSGLIVHNERPVNAETPPHWLDADVTPNEHFFVRNNGLPPVATDTPGAWSFTVDGEVHRPLTLTLADLQHKFKEHTFALQIECGGNGRAGFYPSAKGNQWRFGAVGCARFTGVRLGDVLKAAGVKASAVYTGYYGADLHLSGDPNKASISRGTPIAKALEEHTLIAWAMNDEPLPLMNGFPLRLVTPGWPGSTSPKWLRRIWVRDRVHDGMKMDKYRVPRYPVQPGAKVPQEDMTIIESMPVKSLITSPETGIVLKQGQVLNLRGHAWAGDRSVAAMHVSIDFGATWQGAPLKEPVNRYAWQRWQTQVRFPEPGYYEVWARATDEEGVMQPMVVPGWNPSGYLNNAMHRIAVTVQ
ncbi:sulfite oxidase [Nitrospina watsonii]|uniref:Sulfite:cytochrome c oxidoreductase, subunit A n=1 Tax=Nitrospina watsonii TaxID=1323948 RepID=A0ABN8VYA5_9BACT|nr:sulfite oxidase [Nitrospina watsonii]CAI2717118.1 Putative Sulfite:cytochrome c oxidoreductase, subunit A [Nitrospina watsonii]